jgi:hypothetical protein
LQKKAMSDFGEDNSQKQDDLLSLIEKNIGSVFASNICLYMALKYKNRITSGKGRFNDEKKLDDYLCRYNEICLKNDFPIMNLDTFEYIVKHGTAWH